MDVPPGDREVLESWARSPSIRAGLAQRARIVLLAADDVPVKDIVTMVGVSKPTVVAWKKRYLTEGLPGLDDRAKPGRPQRVDELQVVLETLSRSTWSSRQLAVHIGLSHVWVTRIWRRWGLLPMRDGTVKFATEPELAGSIGGVVGLHLRHPENAIVLSAAPSKPLGLLKALRTEGSRTDFQRFLRQVAKAHPNQTLYVVSDNNRANLQLSRNPQITLHTTPTTAAWLNLAIVFLALAGSPEAIPAIRRRVDDGRPLNWTQVKGLH